MIKSLKAREHNLSKVENQLKMLEDFPEVSGLPSFTQKLDTTGMGSIHTVPVEIFQVNVGYMCNQVCRHCHVDAGPDRKEIMTEETMRHCLDFLRSTKVTSVDLTGGAPEMNPRFRKFVEEIREIHEGEIIVRSNLTILRSNQRYYDLPEFFRKNKVRVVSSLPFYARERTDRQRGEGVFDKSIEAIISLNEAGYGVDDQLILDLVYNPGGAFLPASQIALERDFKKELWENHNIRFNNLLTITNLPISRFLEYLVESDNFEDYMDLLINSFNPATVEGLMCRNTLSVGWDGTLYDCDFNQMLGLPIASTQKNISEVTAKQLTGRAIVTGQHCYGCTAGAGSGCQGSVL